MDDSLLIEFINESREHLGNIEANLLSIEERGSDLDEALVNQVFRAAHSIKGGSSFFGLTKVKELAHRAETVLDMIRSRKIVPNAEVTNVLLASFDKLRDMINNPDERDNADIDDLVVGLTGLASSYLPAEQKASLHQDVSLNLPGTDDFLSLPKVDFERVKRSGFSIYKIDYDLIHDVDKKGLNLLAVFNELDELGEILECKIDFDAVGTLNDSIRNQLPLQLIFASSVAVHIMSELVGVENEKVHLLFDPCNPSTHPKDTTLPAISAPHAVECKELPGPTLTPRKREDVAVPTPILTPALPSNDKEATPTSVGTLSAEDETLRVNVRLLETLMNLAGELVLSRNQLRAAISHNDTQSLAVAEQRLNQVTSELQDAIMLTRLQPVGNVFSKFPRVVRDMSAALHKEIQLDIRGKEVALDRTLIEGLTDPLTHMVRNAVDHGIELPDDRVRKGKKRSGLIRIEARHEAGQVLVEIADDGKGIDPERVAQSALAKGLVSEAELLAMSEREKRMLIFLPGLSTAEKVTDISGRGVGMDVVKTNLEKLGGQIELLSEIGKGSLFRIKLPLTLAIIPSLIVSVNGNRFAIPQMNVEELLHVPVQEVKRRIDVVGEAEVLLLRERMLPLVRFETLLTGNAGRQKTAHSGLADNKSESQQGKAVEVVVITTGNLTYGLVVDSFHDTEEIVVKPLGRHLKNLREYAGATVLGDGTVALIVDAGGIADKSELGASDGASRLEQTEEDDENVKKEDTHSFLLFHNGPEELCATPLDIVLRIERVTPEQVETFGKRRTIQYRGASLPLVTLADTAQVQPIGNTRDLAVIISSVRGREVGLLGAMPVDVIETKAAIDQTTHRQKGIAGSAIIGEHTVLIADVFEMVDEIYPEWAKDKGSNPMKQQKEQGAVVLLAEDSDFFRAQMRRFLEDEGFTVVDMPDGEQAWQALNEHINEIRLLVTDIEMPNLTGIGLAQRVRADSRTSSLPIIAVTSLASEEDMAKGKSAGISDYQIKLDRDRLVESVRNYIFGKPATK